MEEKKMFYKDKLAILLCVLTLCVIVATFYNKYSRSQHDISCVADFTLHVGNDELKAFYTIKMSQGKGNNTLISHLLKNSETAGYISRQINFSYVAKDNHYHIYNSTVQRLQMDNLSDDVVKNYIDDAFIKTVKERKVEIIPTLSGGWVFNLYSSPLFICNKA